MPSGDAAAATLATKNAGCAQTQRLLQMSQPERLQAVDWVGGGGDQDTRKGQPPGLLPKRQLLAPSTLAFFTSDNPHKLSATARGK